MTTVLSRSKESNLNYLNEITSDCVYSMFHLRFTPSDLAEECERPVFDDRFIVLINFTNDQNQAQIILGVEEIFLKQCFEELSIFASDDDELFTLTADTLSELVNVICGEFTGSEEFINAYGTVDLSVPVFIDRHDINMLNLPKTFGIKGSIISDDKSCVINTYISHLV